MLDDDEIACPLCEAPLAHKITPFYSAWTCSNCNSTFAPQELAEKWEGKVSSKFLSVTFGEKVAEDGKSSNFI